MSTIKDKLYFNYDGKSSREFGLINVNLSNDMFEESIVGNREIIETSIAGSDRPNFNRLRTSPREFDMNIAFENDFTEKQLDEVVIWLFQDRYKPLFFEENPNKLYYCTPISEPKIIHNGLMQGYVSIRMRCDSSFVYSQVMISEKYNLANNKTGTNIEIENRGHFNMYPEISIEKIGDGHISITDISNGGKIFEVRDLTNKEKIYINSEKEIIETDIIGEYRYDNVIGSYLEFPYGRNIINVVGDCHIQFRYQYKLKF